MADLFSELKRVKAELKNNSTKPATEPARTAVAPLNGLPKVAPLRKQHGEPAPSMQSNPVGHKSSSTSVRNLSSGVTSVDAPSTQRILSTRRGQPSATSSHLTKSPAPLPVVNKPLAAQPSATAKPRISPPKQEPPRSAPAPAKHGAPVPTDFRPLAKGALTRRGLFCEPAFWLSAGGKTQCIETGHKGSIDIVIELDFGTSFTKAAVGFKDKIFPVTWEGVSRCKPDYLLPSEYTELDDGSLFIGQHTHAINDQVRGDLKLPFINTGVSSASICKAAAFVALVLRYIRAWVYHHHAVKLGCAKIRWQLNVGAPCNGLEAFPLDRAYKALAATAWSRSLETDPLRLAGSASELWRETKALPDVVECQIFPEFVAQMAGYMQSPQRQLGLHALVDVGGGTFDVVTFIVHRVEDVDTFPFLVPQVHPLGTHGLIQNRLIDVELGPNMGVVDELAPIDAAAAFARVTGISESHVATRDALFMTELRRVIKGVFDTTRSRRYRLSDAWRTGVRTFFTGGGSQLELYREALMTTAVPSAQGLHLTPLPPHKNLDGFQGGTSEYQRVSVACGLAKDALTLGLIVPAKEVEDDRAIMPSRQASRLDRDERYPK